VPAAASVPQIEDCYISAAELARLTGVHQELLLRNELMLLEGLKFDFIVFSPYRAIEGFMEVGGGTAAVHGPPPLVRTQLQMAGQPCWGGPLYQSAVLAVFP
jgi:hypothetical protein